ncbi:hypothetical protein ABFS82_13G109300 [Erythranthe guttata]|uniref:glucose-induced degradation protein 8 homolog n=1 Tax=Erythranthe guttata TaxID=4155 RepID=UPI00064D8869|nr:PREDICTED: glucose-induced degradation protein 8 homolog [Erythranthe guttata]|eukprot:XP_012849380.1 PREDICTED: glucose-induced degradation protein 8 homolog [Erythranthe guttata]
MDSSRKDISWDKWEGWLSSDAHSISSMQKLVINYMTTEGYIDAAEIFQLESGIKPDVDCETVVLRTPIKKAIQSGDAERAIEELNHLNPSILKENPGLAFRLEQLLVIELIRNNNLEEALKVAQEELAPIGEKHNGLLEELERTVSLLAFEDFKNCSAADLLDVSRRTEIANEVDSYVLSRFFDGKDAKTITGSMKNLMLVVKELGKTEAPDEDPAV